MKIYKTLSEKQKRHHLRKNYEKHEAMSQYKIPAVVPQKQEKKRHMLYLFQINGHQHSNAI